jgi:hypothetical protein
MHWSFDAGDGESSPCPPDQILTCLRLLFFSPQLVEHFVTFGVDHRSLYILSLISNIYY